MPIAVAEDTRNNYSTYGDEMIEIVPIIEPGHAANASEEGETFTDNFIRYR